MFIWAGPQILLSSPILVCNITFHSGSWLTIGIRKTYCSNIHVNFTSALVFNYRNADAWFLSYNQHLQICVINPNWLLNSTVLANVHIYFIPKGMMLCWLLRNLYISPSKFNVNTPPLQVCMAQVSES